MATIKIYKPTGSLQVYFKKDTDVFPTLVTSTHLRIYVEQNLASENLAIRDELLNKFAVKNRPITEMQDEAGASIGATMEEALLYLAKIIG